MALSYNLTQNVVSYQVRMFCLKRVVAKSSTEDFCERNYQPIIRYLFIYFTLIYSLSLFFVLFCFPRDDQCFVVQLVIWRPKFHLRLPLDTDVLLL